LNLSFSRFLASILPNRPDPFSPLCYQDGMERKDLLEKNCGIFKQQGELLNTVASKNVKVLVVGNPANTNCLTAADCAPNIPRSKKMPPFLNPKP